MKLPKSLAQGMQNKLRVLTYDCYCADAFTSGLTSLDDGDSARWQTAIDTLYRFIRSDLLWSPSVTEGSPPLTQEDYLAYMLRLAQSNPFSKEANYFEQYSSWVIWDFCLTDSAKDFIGRHNLRGLGQELSVAFVDELEQRFIEHGVRWSDTPLIPIKSEI